MMCWHTMQVLSVPMDYTLLKIVALSTLFSYNLHWYLTNDLEYHRIQNSWITHHKKVHLFIFIIAGVLLSIELFQHPTYILPLIPAALASALYTFPKIPFYPFTLLKKWAIAKTLYLTVVWTYVTVGLALISHPGPLENTEIWYIINQFCYIYAICILFDYKDIKSDLAAGIPSIYHHLGVKRSFIILYVIIALGISASLFLGEKNLVMMHLVPYIAILYSIPIVRKGANDYFYYGWLDGCMMAAAVLHCIEKI